MTIHTMCGSPQYHVIDFTAGKWLCRQNEVKIRSYLGHGRLAKGPIQREEYGMSTPLQWCFGSFRLDAAAGCLWRGDELVELSPKPMALLIHLVTHAGQVVSKEALLDAVWPETSVTEGVLKTNMGLIRQLLGETARTPQYISTVRGRGYRFIAPVTSVVPPMPTFTALSEVWQPQIHTEDLEVRSPIIGREAELARLHAHFEKACQGERQLVSITGEPGIGKTTLVDAFVSQVVSSRPLWQARGQCIDHYGAGEAYLPLLDALGRLARGKSGDSLVEVLRRQAPSWLMHFPALGHPEDLEKWQGLQGMVTRQRMLRELVDTVETLTLDQPLILVLEDLHWSDASTVDWLGYVARRRDGARLLILGTYRPVDTLIQDHPIRRVMQELQRHGQCTELALPYFTEREIAAYLEQQFTSTSLPENLPVTLRQRTGGNPFFLVTIVEALAQADASHAGVAQVDGAEELTAIDIETPESIRVLIEQQLERLELEDQDLLQAASVVGKTFTAPAVAACVLGDIESVESRFEALVQRRQFIEAHDTEVWPDGTLAVSYTFIHALYQEVVYNRLPASRKARWHHQIGVQKETSYGDQAAEIAAELSTHFLRARDGLRAIQYLRQAGANAMRRHAHQEVLELLYKGVEALALLPNGATRLQHEIALYLSLGTSLTATRGYAAPEVEQVYSRARELCQQVDDPQQHFRALLGLQAYYVTRGNLAAARAMSEQALHIAQLPGQSLYQLLRVCQTLGQISFHMGEFVEAKAHLEQGLQLDAASEPSGRPPLQDPGVVCLTYLALTLAFLGYPTQAQQYSHEALALAHKLMHPFNLIYAHWGRACLYQFYREVSVTQECTEALLALAAEYDLPFYSVFGTCLHGWVLGMKGQDQQGITLINEGLAASHRFGAALVQPALLICQATLYSRSGQIEAGLQALDTALGIMKTNDDHWAEAEAYRLRGDLLAQVELGAPADKVGEAPARQSAEGCFFQALTVARHQQAKAWELRTAMSLARLWQSQAKRQDAYDLLAPVYGWFTEGFDTTDLIEAKGLLDELELELT